MKKNCIIILSVILLATFACKSPEPPPLPPPNNGTVSLNRSEITIEVGKSAELIPSYSSTGTAKSKEYVWITSNSTIVLVEEGTAGVGKITGVSTGEATIEYKAKDMTISASCKVKVIPQDHGTVSLNVTLAELIFGQELQIVPKYSVSGSAKDKKYTWSLSDSTVVKGEKKSDGTLTVTASRIGETTIHYKAEDQSISAICKIAVHPRSKVIPPLYYKKGATVQEIKDNEIGKLNTAESTETMLVYEQSVVDAVKVTHTIYRLDTDRKLVATYAVLENNAENKLKLEQYMEERYDATNKTKGGITYFDVGNKFAAPPVYPTNTLIGIFIDTSATGLPETYKLGVRIVDDSLF